MNNKDKLISDILHCFKFDYLEALIVEDIQQSGSCSAEKWNELLQLNNLRPYAVAKKALEIAYKQENNNATIDSLKAEIYQIGNKNSNRKPSPKHIEALLKTISRKHSSPTNSLRGGWEIQKLLVLTQTLQAFTGDKNVIFYFKDKVAEILSNLNIDTLQEIYKKFASNEWVNTDEEDPDDYYITNYLKDMDETNFWFLYYNYESLCKCYKTIKFILGQLVYADADKLKKEYENLKKKRIYSSEEGECFCCLKKIKYEPTSEPVTEEMINTIEQNLLDCPEMESLIFYIGHLTPLKWNFLLLLIRNYEKYPTGKKVNTWLEKI